MISLVYGDKTLPTSFFFRHSFPVSRPFNVRTTIKQTFGCLLPLCSYLLLFKARLHLAAPLLEAGQLSFAPASFGPATCGNPSNNSPMDITLRQTLLNFITYKFQYSISAKYIAR